jgi:hypothetical protein
MKTFTGTVPGEPGRAFEFDTLTELTALFGGDYCRPLRRERVDTGMRLLGVYQADGTLLIRVLVPVDAVPDPNRPNPAKLLAEVASELEDIAENADAHLSDERCDPRTVAEWTVRRARKVAQRAQHEARDAGVESICRSQVRTP